MKKITVMLAVLFALSTFITGCGKSDVPPANAVWMENIAFVPNSITVPVNTTITWTNKDVVTHNVTSDSGWFASGNVAPGGTYNRQFTTAGTFAYRCTIHAGMTGTVIVH